MTTPVALEDEKEANAKDVKAVAPVTESDPVEEKKDKKDKKGKKDKKRKTDEIETQVSANMYLARFVFSSSIGRNRSGGAAKEEG